MQVHFGALKSISRMQEKLAEYAVEVRDAVIYKCLMQTYICINAKIV
jgi:hypothetical protein